MFVTCTISLDVMLTGVECLTGRAPRSAGIRFTYHHRGEACLLVLREGRNKYGRREDTLEEGWDDERLDSEMGGWRSDGVGTE